MRVFILDAVRTWNVTYHKLFHLNVSRWISFLVKLIHFFYWAEVLTSYCDVWFRYICKETRQALNTFCFTTSLSKHAVSTDAIVPVIYFKSKEQTGLSCGKYSQVEESFLQLLRYKYLFEESEKRAMSVLVHMTSKPKWQWAWGCVQILRL
jgi:hypothetical protein